MTDKKGIILFIFIFTTICLHSGIIYASTSEENLMNLSVLVDISEERLYLIDTKENKILKTYVVASGKASSPSPVGTWNVISLSKSTGCFGARWIGLNVPWGNYAIHGTDLPGSIGSKASHGCIRMLNSDVKELYEYMQYGTVVVIDEGPLGPFEKGFRKIKPGDRGSEVFEIQKRMKDLGYYPRTPTGIYGEGMQRYVLKFKADNKLKCTDIIDWEFCKKLGMELMD